MHTYTHTYTHTQNKFTLRSLVDISHGKIQKKTIFKKKNSNSTQDEDCKGIPPPTEEGLVPGNSRDTYPCFLLYLTGIRQEDSRAPKPG